MQVGSLSAIFFSPLSLKINLDFEKSSNVAPALTTLRSLTALRGAMEMHAFPRLWPTPGPATQHQQQGSALWKKSLVQSVGSSGCNRSLFLIEFSFKFTNMVTARFKVQAKTLSGDNYYPETALR